MIGWTGGPTFPCHDLLATMAVVEPSVLQEVEHCHVVVETAGVYTVGQYGSGSPAERECCAGQSAGAEHERGTVGGSGALPGAAAECTPSGRRREASIEAVV